MNDSISVLQQIIDKTFTDTFGRTPLTQRIDDIFGETVELIKYTDFKNLKEETGDLLCTLIQLCNENEWNVEELTQNTLLKILNRKDQYKSLGRKLKVAILGGAFNPITNGHIDIAKFVLDTSKTFDEVWIMPCFNHLYGKKLVSPEHRLKMCELASKVDGRIKVFDYEIKNELAGETYHFVKRLLSEDYSKDKYDFSMIIGMDNANTFGNWVNYRELERIMRFVVVDRGNWDREKNVTWYLSPPHIYLNSDAPISDVSSTKVRHKIGELYSANNMHYNNIRDLINEDVLNYIIKNGLYHYEINEYNENF